MSTAVIAPERRPMPLIRARRTKPNGHGSALHTPLTKADKKMFASLRIDPKLLEAAGVCRVSTQQAQNLGFHFTRNADLSGIFFPYADADGAIQNGRIRRDSPEMDSNGEPENKYISMPKRGHLRLLFRPPGAAEALNDPEAQILLVEAEKSALAITAAARRARRKVIALALGGCWGWREKEQDDPNTKGEKKQDRKRKREHRVAIPDLDILRGRQHVRVMFDSNCATNDKVQAAELALCSHLATIGATATCHRVPAGRGVNGPDDFLAKHSDGDFWKLLDKAVEPWLDAVGESYEQYSVAKPPEFVIKDFTQNNGLTIIGGLSGHGKTWVLFSMMQSLLTGNALFGEFKVVGKASRVIYLSPEITLGGFRSRAEKFGFGPHIQSQQLLVRTLTAYPMLPLTDPALLLSVRGADVILDTAVRFMEGDESSSTDNDRGLADAVFGLLHAGARTVTAAHHSPKAFDKQDYMTLENMLRGTGDIGAMASTVWGVRMLDVPQTRLYVENVKARDFTPPPQFQLIGRPHIDDGKGLQMHLRPGESGRMSDYVERKAGRKRSSEKADRQAVLFDAVKAGQSDQQISAIVNEKGYKLKPSTLKKEIREARRAAKAKF